MKKLVLATILVASSIVASAQVTVYGNLRTFVDNTKVGSGPSVTSMVSDSSRIGFTASEKVALGLTARATVETALDSADPAAASDTKLGNRQSTVGLAYKNGTVDFGRKLNAHFLAVNNHDPFGTNYGSIAGAVHNTRTVRSGDAVFMNYQAGPVALSLDRTVSGANEVTTYSASGNIGPVLATVARFDAGSETSNVFAAKTTFRGAQFALSHSQDRGIAGDSRGTLVSVAYPLANTPWTMKTSYGVKTGDVRAFNLGAEYALSKRVAILAAYRSVDDKVDVKQFGAGLTYQF